MTEQKPTVGRIVHFYDHNTEKPGPLAAMVAFVYDDQFTENENLVNIVNLSVLNHTGSHWYSEKLVPPKTEGAKRYWEWPPRV